MFDCPQCDQPSKEFREGYCLDCCAENQRLLDEHNASFDRWQRLTDDERSDEIRRAIG